MTCKDLSTPRLERQRTCDPQGPVHACVQGPGQRDLRRKPPKASKDLALPDLYNGNCDLHRTLRGATCASVEGPGQKDLPKTCPRPQGTPRCWTCEEPVQVSRGRGTRAETRLGPQGPLRWWTCIRGLVTRKDLSMFAVRKTGPAYGSHQVLDFRRQIFNFRSLVLNFRSQTHFRSKTLTCNSWFQVLDFRFQVLNF